MAKNWDPEIESCREAPPFLPCKTLLLFFSLQVIAICAEEFQVHASTLLRIKFPPLDLAPIDDFLVFGWKITIFQFFITPSTFTSCLAIFYEQEPSLHFYSLPPSFPLFFLLSFLHLIIYLLLVWTHGSTFSIIYNLLLFLNYCVPHIFPGFSSWSPFRVGPVFLWHASSFSECFLTFWNMVFPVVHLPTLPQS